MNGQNVGRSRQGERTFGPFEAQRARLLRGQRPRVGEDVHPESESALPDRPADVSRSNDADRAAVETARLGEFLLLPLALSEGGYVVRNAPVHRENQSQGQLGDGNRILARAVGHVDPPSARRFDVDRIYPGASANDQGEAGSLRKYAVV